MFIVLPVSAAKRSSVTNMLKGRYYTISEILSNIYLYLPFKFSFTEDGLAAETVLAIKSI